MEHMRTLKLPPFEDYSSGYLFTKKFENEKLQPTISPQNISLNFAKYPHLLIGGSSGFGKSTLIKTIIYSLLFNNFVKDTQFILIDLKRVELSIFKKLPHVLYFADDILRAKSILFKTLLLIDTRYKNLERLGTTHIDNLKAKQPHIFLIIDEYAELILQDKKIESLVIRISQIGRAAGVHLIICTQLPTAKIISNLINVNMSQKIAFKVGTPFNSRCILDTTGAEKLTTPGEALLKIGCNIQHFNVYHTPPEDFKKMVQFWVEQYNKNI